MSYRPDLHTPGHDQWDQGGYCNNLVVDDDGCGVVCGYRAPRDPHAQTVETLIAEARDIWEADDLYPDQMIPRLVKALEAVDQRAAELAAVIEQAEDYVTRHYLDTRFGDEVLPILASAPADALREVKAEAWDEGYFRRMDDYPFDPEERDNPYREGQS